MRTWLAALSLIAGLFGLIADASAKVVKFEIVRIEPAFEGRVFGSVGTYDRIIARATVALSPSDPHNTIIVDLDRAPRNAQGLVEATADVEILRPTNAANGNRRLHLRRRQPRQPAGARLFQRRPRRQRFLQGSRRRQRVPDEPRLHGGDQRLARRSRPPRRLEDHLGPDRAEHHRTLTRRVHFRPHAQSRGRDPHLSGGRSRSGQGDADGAPARDRSARHAGRSQLHLRGAGQNLDQAPGRF